MKLFCILMLFSFSLWGQVEVLQNFDKKIYTPRLKAVTDLVVDVENEKLLSQLNDQKIFGHLKHFAFRFYWTAQPERLAVDVIGLPEGFKEIKEELKASALPLFENIMSIPLEKRFANFTFTKKSAQVIEAKSKDNLSAVDSFSLHFDSASILTKVVTHRAVGEMVTKYVYDKASFTDGRLVLKAQETLVEEMGNKISVNKEISYQNMAGVGVPETVSVKTKQQGPNGNLEQVENMKFSNYQINKGEAIKYFLSESK